MTTTTSESIPSQIEGFVVLPLRLPPLPSYPIEATHYLYVSVHQPKIPPASASRSLFLANIPFDTTELHLKTLFSSQLDLPAGRVEQVEFDGGKWKAGWAIRGMYAPRALQTKKKRKRRSEGELQEELEASPLPTTWDRDLHGNASTAVIIFVDRASMEAALMATKAIVKRRKTYPTWGEGLNGKLPPLGYERYAKHQQLTYPDQAELLESVNAYMTTYAAEEVERARLRASQRQEPDEDGFITVTRGGRTNPAAQEFARAVAEKHKERHKGLNDFYRFQGRERKKAKAIELTKRFEEDKERIRKMKEKKGSFQPE